LPATPCPENVEQNPTQSQGKQWEWQSRFANSQTEMCFQFVLDQGHACSLTSKCVNVGGLDDVAIPSRTFPRARMCNDQPLSE
jgi:hypothetical protein